MGHVHVVGAGLAGLAAALTVSADGRGARVSVHEAADHAGGRCRSFHDAVLDRMIDNGNHLILGANPAVFAFLDEVGGGDALHGLADQGFPFVDLATGETWCLRPGTARLPLWLLDKARRVAGAGLRDHLALLPLALPAGGASVAARTNPANPLYRRLIEPLTVAVMNADPADADAGLMARVLRQTLGRGGNAATPYIARDGLGPALVDPAVATLTRRGARLAWHTRLRAVEVEPDRRAGALVFTTGTLTLGPADRVVLAVPPDIAAELIPGLVVPQGSRPILNAHFLLPAPLPGPPTLCGIVGGKAQWLFLRGDIASVTISAAGDLIDRPAESLAADIWAEVARTLGLWLDHPVQAGPPPPCRIVKEKRATFLQSPANESRRPGPVCAVSNLFLAGDWTATGLPATIEGSIRSGREAGRLALA